LNRKPHKIVCQATAELVMQECVGAQIFNAVELFMGLYDWSEWFFNEYVELLSTAVYSFGTLG